LSVGKPELGILEPAASPGHLFAFTLYARNSARQAYPLPLTLKLAGVVPSLTFATRIPRLTLDATDVFGAASTSGAFAPTYFRSNLASQSLDLDTYRITRKPNFRVNGFELIHSIAPETTSQERSQ
jgi:hypothetical protein